MQVDSNNMFYVSCLHSVSWYRNVGNSRVDLGLLAGLVLRVFGSGGSGGFPGDDSLKVTCSSCIVQGLPPRSGIEYEQKRSLAFVNNFEESGADAE